MVQKINAEWHVSEVNNPIGTLTIAYIENGHVVRTNIFQPADPANLETEVMRAWPHEQFKTIHASGVAPHPVYAKMIGEQQIVSEFTRPQANQMSPTTGPTSSNIEEL